MNIMPVINAVITILGIYLIFVSIRMKKTQKVNTFIVDEETLNRCKDQAAFAEFLFPKMLMFSVILAFTGGIRLVHDLVYQIGIFQYIVAFIAFIAFLVFYKQLTDGRNKYC
jgi:hypothetical protein